MANKMLIDATHPEETRVVVVRGNRVEEFDYEAASRKQLRGNIYLAKVTRVEPSLQAAFIEYGGNRHGFLAFSEIHPDYYQIPVADRLALIEEEERAARQADEEDERRERRRERSRPRAARSESSESSEARVSGNVEEIEDSDVVETIEDGQISGSPYDDVEEAEIVAEAGGESAADDEGLPAPQAQARSDEDAIAAEAPEGERENTPILAGEAGPQADGADEDEDEQEEDEGVEQMGSADALEEVPERAPQRRGRSYKIQEVIRRRQVMLVQVVKEERGNKGAALTTYLSLAGRYSVLMPNTARGGGISRKITNTVDRKRLKEVVQDLEVPEGMGVILRTAGANRTKVEIKRDFEYLLRLWETVRELTLGSSAPSLVYEEGSLIKRAIRDLYNKDIDDIYVAGDEGYREARDFMRMLMPSHAKNVIAYNDHQPIFAKHGVEHQLDAMFSPVVQLKSGGYIVINPTEALVSIDVNSGRSTREHHIEDTALKTNMEASEEIARQLRLRDLAGLIVIDFIDMEEKRNNRSVERKLKDCLKNDRARIQVGRISHFGLMEMSRQRIRTGVLESSIEVCPVCGGTGHVRSAASVALQLLRALEEQLLRATTHNLVARTRGEVALYVLNNKRAHLRELEERFSVTLIITADETVNGHHPFIIEKGDPAVPAPAAPRLAKVVQPDSILPEEAFEDEDEEETEATEAEAEGEGEAEAEGEEGAERSEDNGNRRRRRRRRRRGGERETDGEGRAEGEAAGESEPADAQGAEAASVEGQPAEAGIKDEPAAGETEAEGEGEEDDDRGDESRSESERRRRRRGRRGGRRNRREDEANGASEGEGDGETDQAVAATSADMESMPAEGVTDAVAPVIAEAAPVAEAPAEVVPVEVAPVQSVPVDSAPVEAPAPAPAEPVAAEPAPATPTRAPRRRSTVREKAPTTSAASEPAAPAAVAEPVVAPVVAPEEVAAPVSSVVEVASEDASMPIADADIMAGTTGSAETEAAPGLSDEGPAEAAAAPPAETTSADAAPEATAEGEAAKPRSGWWQRRLFGA